MTLPDRVAAELLADEHLQQQFAHRLQRRIGQQQLQAPAAVLGSRLELECTPSSPVALRCGGVQLFRRHMGRRGGHIAVQIQDRLMK